MRRGLAALAIGLVTCGLLCFHVTLWRAGDGLRMRNARRLWEDVSLAGSRYGRHDAQVGPEPTGIGEGAGFAVRRAYQRRLADAAEQDGIRPWEFWRTVRVKGALMHAELVPRTADDVGRAALLYHGFRLLGGVSPLLGLWVGALVCLPVMLWTACELGAAGRPVAAAVFLTLVACSPFVVEVLTLPYSAVGFALVALLALVPFGVYAFLGHGRSRAGFAVRAGAAGLLLALCILCRSGAVVVAPGYLVAAAAAAVRVFPPGPPGTGAWRRHARPLLAFSLGALALLTPYAVVRTEHHHYAWTGIWEGLGDFDRTRAHAWSDPEARRALRREGIAIPARAGLEFELGGNADVLGRLVVEHVRSDPGWFAAILSKRLIATLGQTRLWPRASRDGVAFVHSTTPNEGAMDIYYRLATTADVLAVGPYAVELPVALLPLPTLGLLALWAWRREPRATASVCLLACVAAAALVHPVLITTASALETEFFVVVDMLGAALLADELVRRRDLVSAEVVEPDPAAGTGNV